MCLNAMVRGKRWWNKDVLKAEVAKRDIKVYKFYKVDSATGQLISPFIGHRTEVGAKLYENRFVRQLKRGLDSRYVSLEYGLHSFVEAITTLRPFGQLFECTIPQGARYFKGTWEDTGIKSIISDKLIINKKVQ